MPLVEVYFDPERADPRRVSELAKRLPYLVAKYLSVSGITDGQLTHRDVEVRVRTKGPHDITAYGLEITVWAKHYPDRERLLDHATGQIARLSSLVVLGDVKGFVYILLAPAGFAEFEFGTEGE